MALVSCQPFENSTTHCIHTGLIIIGETMVKGWREREREKVAHPKVVGAERQLNETPSDLELRQASKRPSSAIAV
jgi:hypothetical protein